jgi:hypothetical protein
MPLVAQRPTDRIVLGLMTFGPDAQAGARVTEPAEYAKVLDYFQSKGYNEVDTARTYVGGKQESFTRDAKWKDRGLTLATKHYPFQPGEHSPEKLRTANETSLKELGTDTVDIYYLHAADRSVPFETTLREVDKLHKEGKFVQLGLSNFAAFEVAEVVMTCKANGWVRPTIYQGMYLEIPFLYRSDKKMGIRVGEWEIGSLGTVIRISIKQNGLRPYSILAALKGKLIRIFKALDLKLNNWFSMMLYSCSALTMHSSMLLTRTRLENLRSNKTQECTMQLLAASSLN